LFEFDRSVHAEVGLALVVILYGAGKWSIDRLLGGRLDVQRLTARASRVQA